MKNKKHYAAGTKYNRKIVEKYRYPNAQIHDRALSWLGTGTSIKRGGVKLLL
jgi:hypothetical protein